MQHGGLAVISNPHRNCVFIDPLTDRRALVRRPAVLLMDEPLSNLDAKLRGRMRFELRRLHEMHGTTTLYVTHDQIEAMTLADRIAILKDGKLQQHAPPLEAYQKPANAFVASFLGTPAMNLIQGQAEDGKFRAGALSFELPDHLKHHVGAGTFGLRPETVRMGSRGVRFRVGGVEHLGGERVYHLEAGGHWIKVLWRRSAAGKEPPSAQPGEEIGVQLADPAAQFFEGE